MEEFKNILFEYFVLAIILGICFAFYFMQPDVNGNIFVVAIFIIYLRHHHIGEKLIKIKAPKGVWVKSISGRKLFHLLDILTLAVIVLLYLGWLNFYFSALIFVIWFIITDIFRERRCIYGNYISRWFYTSKININNSKWRVHKSDKDPFPSVPHMHALDKSIVINIYTGEIYDSSNRNLIEVASKKDLKKLWSDSKFRMAVEEARSAYLKDNPDFKLEQLPNFE